MHIIDMNRTTSNNKYVLEICTVLLSTCIPKTHSHLITLVTC
jgi:hypothetical protein